MYSMHLPPHRMGRPPILSSWLAAFFFCSLHFAYQPGDLDDERRWLAPRRMSGSSGQLKATHSNVPADFGAPIRARSAGAGNRKIVPERPPGLENAFTER